MRFIFNLSARRNSHQRLVKSMSVDGFKKKLVQTTSALGLMVAAHTGAMMAFEGLSFNDALWLTMTTATTVGYGDLSAHTVAGRLSTIALMYGAGIALLAQGASLFFEWQQAKRDRLLSGKWNWNIEDHTIFLNTPKSPVPYFRRLMNEFRHSALPGSKDTILVVSDRMDNFPEELRQQNMTFVNADLTSEEAFENSNLKKAKTIVVMSRDDAGVNADSVTFELVTRARKENPDARIIAECNTEHGRRMVRGAGANQIIRPMRAYPEMLMRAILSPGIESVIEDLFDTDGEEPVRYDVALKGKWGDIAAKCVKADIGMPLAYIDQSGRAVADARPEDEIDAKAILVIARGGNQKHNAEVGALLSGTPLKSANGELENSGHIVFVNSPQNPGRYFKSLMTEFRKSANPAAKRSAVIITDRMTELPSGLDGKDITLVSADLGEDAGFEKGKLKSASTIIVMNEDENDPYADSKTYALVVRAREMNPDAQIIAESVSDGTRRRLLEAGASQVIRPMRAYPEMLMRAILSPGMENVVEDLFDTHGEEPVCYKIAQAGKWSDIAVRCIANDVGLPVAYVDRESGKVVANAHPDDVIDASAILAVVREGNLKGEAEVACLMADHRCAISEPGPRLGAHH